MKDRTPPPEDDRPTTKVPYEGTARRGFFAGLLAGTIGVVLGLIPAGIGIAFFLDPLRRQRSGGVAAGSVGDRKDADGFIRLGITVSALPEDGTPMAYKVLDDKTDAWNRFSNVEVGTVWLRRTGENQVLALNSICPHLGCAVDYRPPNDDYYCPCHMSAFSLGGEKTNDIPPRGMDSLEIRIKPGTGDTIWLKYENFRATLKRKIPVS